MSCDLIISAIHMPSQNIAESKTGFKTHRNQTLKDLIPLCKHHNTTVRKGRWSRYCTDTNFLSMIIRRTGRHERNILCSRRDRASKFGQHFRDNHRYDFRWRKTRPWLTPQPLHLPARSDQWGDPLNFKSKHSAGDSHLCRQTTANTFAPLFVVYISSGMTHLTQPIRLDSLAFLNLWIERFPAIITRYSEEVSCQKCHDDMYTSWSQCCRSCRITWRCCNPKRSLLHRRRSIWEIRHCLLSAQALSRIIHLNPRYIFSFYFLLFLLCLFLLCLFLFLQDFYINIFTYSLLLFIFIFISIQDLFYNIYIFLKILMIFQWLFFKFSVKLIFDLIL